MVRPDTMRSGDNSGRTILEYRVGIKRSYLWMTLLSMVDEIALSMQN
jgi:hypothetical protein